MLRDARGKGVKYEYAQYLLYKITTGKKVLETTRKSIAKRQMPLYLEGVLMLTRIIYFALDVEDNLPPPILMPKDVMTNSYTKKHA